MISFNKTRSVRKFEYVPRYYDEEQEKREQRRNPKLERGSFRRHKSNYAIRGGTQKMKAEDLTLGDRVSTYAQRIMKLILLGMVCVLLYEVGIAILKL